MEIRRDPRLVKNLISLTVGVLGIVGLCDVSQAQIQFADKTATAGPFHVGESYGASVVDFNGDGRPDIFANNHRLRPGIYRNNGKNTANNLTFSQSILEVDTSDTLAPFSWGARHAWGIIGGFRW